MALKSKNAAPAAKQIAKEDQAPLTDTSRPPPIYLAWAIWGLGATFFLFAFYQRVAPAVMAEVLMSEFRLSATALGNLSAFYFYSYVFMQLPTGLMADRWGPRRLLTVGAVVAGLGSLLFGLAPTLWWANAGRLLIGGSVAVAFVATLQLAGRWLPPSQFSLTSGLTTLVGVIGAVFAGVPLQIAISQFGWRPVMVASAMLPFVLAVGTWLFVRDTPQEKGYANYQWAGVEPAARPPRMLVRIRQVFQYRNSWLLTFIPGGIVGSLLTFSGLWGVPFLQTHYQRSPSQAATLATMLLVIWALSGPVWGTYSDRIGRRKPVYLVGCTGVLAGWALLIFIPNLPVWLLVTILAGTGLASGCMMAGYGFMRESVPSHLSGTAVGLYNTGVVFGPMVLQPAVGWMLDQRWQGEQIGAVKVYGLAAYQAGFALMFGWVILSLLLLLLTKETYGRPLATEMQVMREI